MNSNDTVSVKFTFKGIVYQRMKVLSLITEPSTKFYDEMMILFIRNKAKITISFSDFLPSSSVSMRAHKANAGAGVHNACPGQRKLNKVVISVLLHSKGI